MSDEYEADRKDTQFALACIELLPAPEEFKAVARKAIRRHGALQIAIGRMAERLQVPELCIPQTLATIAEDLEKALVVE